MRRALASLRWAGIGVVWDADRHEPEPLQAVAEIVAPSAPAVHVHYHLHIAPGTDPAFAAQALSFLPAVPQQRAVTATPITEGTGEPQ